MYIYIYVYVYVLCIYNVYVFYGGFVNLGVLSIAGWFIMENPSINGQFDDTPMTLETSSI